MRLEPRTHWQSRACASLLLTHLFGGADIKGFGVANYAADFAAARHELANHVLAGKLETEETVFAWEEYGAAHTALHAGGNVGKVLVAGPGSAPSGGGGGGGEQQPPAGDGTAQDVVDFVVGAGAEIGRDTSKIAWALVNDHWIDSLAALKASLGRLPPPYLTSYPCLPPRLTITVLVAPTPASHLSTRRYPPPTSSPSECPAGSPASSPTRPLAQAQAAAGRPRRT